MTTIEIHHGSYIDLLWEGNTCTPVELKNAHAMLEKQGYKRIKMEFVKDHLVEVWDKKENIRFKPPCVRG